MNIIIHITEQLKMKPIDVNNTIHINTDKEVNDKDPKFKVGNHTKTFLLKAILQIDLKKYY